ncbi:glycoside hydrolase family 95 protein [Microlunatus soli]|uniref:Alpha-L-fucosidase 2 n=1 Tax=Microlunatus soli TaxID=630515 RepID=A0A1H1ZS00_9ACTN|nr:glycoside hydrolase family 95 protein [Microlunatus soli]SDT36172.1 alpha-L-fucosidase 2 [Microlunatus soli]
MTVHRQPGSDATLCYDAPASRWTDALPIGSGLVGAMCFGGPDGERLLLNHTTGWSGGPAAERSGTLPSADQCRSALDEARTAVAEGRWQDADRAVQGLQHGNPQSFLPVGELSMIITPTGPDRDAPTTDYRRSLDLATAVHQVGYRRGDSRITITTRASHPHNVLMITVQIDGGTVDLDLALTSQLHTTAAGPDLLLRFPSNVIPAYDKPQQPIVYTDGDQEALDGAIAIRTVHDGIGDHPIRNLRRATILVGIETSYSTPGGALRGDARDALARAVRRIGTATRDGAEVVARAQEDDHRRLFSRCRLRLGSPADELTDRRLAAAFAHGSAALDSDPALAALLFDYGRYLLICSSRAGGLPANLQGIWNDAMQPPWSSDFTMNINLEMNYWLAEPTGLVECLTPLFDFIEALAASGAETAARVFDAPGWVAFHCSDAWGYSQPVGNGSHDPCWAFWPFAGPWLLQQLRERLLHGGGDEVALRAWPLVRGAAEFLQHTMIERDDRTLGTSPSTSPENRFSSRSGDSAATAESSTMDIALAADTYRFLIELSDRLDHDQDPVVLAARAALPRLPRPMIDDAGMIAEWPDRELVPQPDHRHTAHLYLVHPGDQPLEPALAAAADASLTGRGDESTGWSLVWKATMRARLRQPERVADLLRYLFRDAAVDRGRWAGGLYRNLFAAHPPFQIDANLGFVTAVAECLLQSHAGTIDLLPALPAAFGPGSVAGLVARPGVRVDLSWDAGSLTRAVLTSDRHEPIDHPVRYRDRVISCRLEPGRPVELSPRSFDLRPIARRPGS